MKRIVERRYFGVSKPDRGTTIIDKNGLRVENIEPGHATEVDIICSLITQAIDCGEWKHSWHVDVRNARGKNSDERKKIRKIIEDKITEAEQLVQMLKDAKQVLGRWHY